MNWLEKKTHTPKINADILTYCDGKNIYRAKYHSGDYWQWPKGSNSYDEMPLSARVTHWCYLGELPDE